MCLSVPREVLKVEGDVVFLGYEDGARRVDVCLVDVDVGDFVIVVGGAVVDKVERERAVKFLEMIDGRS